MFEQPEGEFDQARQRRKRAFLKDLYDAYKYPHWIDIDPSCSVRVGTRLEEIDTRRCATRAIMTQYGVAQRFSHTEVSFSIVGLWDTVEALGFPDGKENVDAVNPRYADQICNMANVFHAISLDDNRAIAYTPLLMTRNWLVDDCEPGDQDHFANVEEVWFAGDHAQVGGTEQLGHLAGVSLNWMLEKIQAASPPGRAIVPANAGVFAQPLDFVKDAQGQNLLFRLFSRNSRNVLDYAATGKCDDGPYRSAVPFILVHRSVIEALQRNAERIPYRRNVDGELAPALSDEEVLRNRRSLLSRPPSEDACGGVPVLVSDNMQDVTDFLATE